MPQAHPFFGRDVFYALVAVARDVARAGRDLIGTDLVFIELIKGRASVDVCVPQDMLEELRPLLLGKAIVDEKIELTREKGAAAGSAWASFEVDATLNEADWRVAQFGRRKSRSSLARVVSVAWSDSVRAGLAAALVEASSAGVNHAGGTHLLAGLLTDPASAASALLQGAGQDRERTLGRLRSDPLWRRDSEPFAPAVASLEASGEVPAPMPRLARPFVTMLKRTTIRRGGYGGQLLLEIEREAVRQAVRTGSEAVTTAHLVLAIISLGRQLILTGRELPRSPQHAGLDLVAKYADILGRKLEVEGLAAEVADQLSWLQSSERFGDTGGPPWARQASVALDRAIEIARERRDSEVGIAHLLIALLESKEGPTTNLFRDIGQEPAAVRERVAKAMEKKNP